MVDGVVGYNSLSFVVIVTSCIHVAVKAREVGTTYFDADAVSFFKVVGGTHGGQFNFIDLAFFHPYFLLVSVSVAHSLDGFVYFLGVTFCVYVYQFDGNIRIFHV